MKHLSRFVVIVMVVALTALMIGNVSAAPGAFDFTTDAGDPPAAVSGGNTITAEIGGDVTMSVSVPASDFSTGSDTVTWYADAGSSVDPMTAPFSIALEFVPVPTAGYDLTIPAEVVNGLADGQYTWTIIAENDDDNEQTAVDGAPFTFNIDFPPPGAFDFTTDAGDPPAAVSGGNTITAPISGDVTMSVSVPASDFDTDDDTITWYADAGASVDPMTAPFSIPLDFVPVPTAGYDLSIPDGIVNSLPDGQYTWTILAETGGGAVAVDGAPFTFNIDFPAPAAFDFTTDAGEPPAAVSNDFVITAPVGGDVTMSVEVPASGFDTESDTMTWYADAGASVDPMGTPAFALALVYDMGNNEYDLTIPQEVVNGLPDGQYTWTIWAESPSGMTPVDGAPFSFFIDFPAPGAFDFTTDAGEPPAAVSNDFIITAPVGGDVTMSVEVPASGFDTESDTMTWYADAGATVDPMGTPAFTLALVYDMGNNEYDLTIPQAVVNGLADGQYTWTIWAESPSGMTPVDGAPFSFFIDFVTEAGDPPRLSPTDEAALNGPSIPMFTFEDTGEEWYQIWIGWGQNASAPYGYQGLFQWYQADDDSAFGVMGEGICEAGVCTIPVEDTYGIPVGNEEFEWWMTYWSTGDTQADIDNAWNETTFTLGFPMTGNAIGTTVPADDAVLSAAPTEITWDRQDGLLWVRAWLGTGEATGWSTTLFFDWVYADDICDATTCTFNVSGFTFTDNPYELWVEFWGPNGYVTFTQVTDNPLNFTVDTSGS